MANSTLVHINNLDQTNGVIHAHFQDNILIKPYSKIALYNLSLEINDRTFIINETNDRFRMKLTQTGAVYDVELDHGLYTLDNFASELNHALNGCFPSDGGARTGFQFNVEWDDDDDNFKIQFNRIPATSNWYYVVTLAFDRTTFTHNVVADGGLHSFQKNTADAWDAAIMTQYPFIAGTGAVSGWRSATRNDPIIVGLVSSPVLNDYFVNGNK